MYVHFSDFVEVKCVCVRVCTVHYTGNGRVVLLLIFEQRKIKRVKRESLDKIGVMKYVSLIIIIS